MSDGQLAPRTLREAVPVVHWQIVGAPVPPSESDLAAVREEIRGFLDGECGTVRARTPEGALIAFPYVRTGDPGEDAFRELLAAARVPLAYELLDFEPPERDPEHEAEVERQVEEDREQAAFVARAAKIVATAFHKRGPALRRIRRARERAAQAKQPPQVFYEGERTPSGWKWTSFNASREPRSRTRARLRR